MPGRVYDLLFDRAVDQYGYVTSADARELGVDEQRLVDMARRGTLQRVARGVYRFGTIPPTGREQLMEAVLWPRRARGALSHDTALDVHELCDVNPDRVHITVPRAHRITRDIPPVYAIHRRDLAPEDLTTAHGLPTVTPARAIRDALETHLDPRLIEQALETARRRGLVRGEQLAELRRQAAR